MFPAKKMSVQEIETAPSAASIAASVKRSGAHQSLVLRIQKLEAERQDALDTMRLLISTNRNESHDKNITRLERERVAIEDRLRPLKMEIRAHRNEHSIRVRKALAPQIESAARMLVDALAGFNEAVTAINAAESEIEIAGGEPSFIRPPMLGPLECYVRGLVGKGEKS
jgi:hypothetical protein